jgi:hypothetical protein
MPNQSPEFPSVGARARWAIKGGRYSIDVEIVQQRFTNGWRVLDENGRSHLAATSELSPLPAAPHSGKEER